LSYVMSSAQRAITDQPVICLIAHRIHTAELRFRQHFEEMRDS